jgi:multiple sugar transport system substrate-binding protein
MEERSTVDRYQSKGGGQMPRAIVLLAVLTLVSVACGTAASPNPSTAASAAGGASPTPLAVTPEPVATAEGGLTADGKVLIRWFVGLGTGAQPDQIADEQAVVAEFNESQDKIVLSLEIYQNTTAYDILSTQIAAGNPPDIVGPVGFRGFYSYGDQLLDLAPFIAKTKFDTSDMDPAILEAYSEGFGGQVGIPFAIYPSFIYFNKELFDEAGAAYPPLKVGEKYDGKEWNWDTLTELAKELTVDKAGNDATSSSFDKASVTQWGYYMQWTDPRGWGTQRGAGSVVGSDGKAVIPDNWVDAWQWYYDGMWKDHFIPTGTENRSEALGPDNAFQSNHIAMDFVHLWYTCCVNPADGAPTVRNWDIAVPPAVDGKTTAKLHADTFGVMKATKHPDEAFEVLTFLLNNDKLIARYGALPAVKSKQAAFFEALDKRFAPNKVNWSVALAMLGYPDVPSHEADMPNFLKSDAAIKAFQEKLITTPDLDIAKESETLRTTLQSLFDEAK